MPKANLHQRYLFKKIKYKKRIEDTGVSPSLAGGISQKKKRALGLTGRYASSWWNWMGTSGGVSVDVWMGPIIYCYSNEREINS